MEPVTTGSENREVFERAADLILKGHAFVLATVVGATGSTPRKSGAKMIVIPGGESVGTVGGGEVEARVFERAEALLAGGEQTDLVDFDLASVDGPVCGGGMSIFLEAFSRPRRMLIFGAGHVGAAVCPLLLKLGWMVTVYDEREARLDLPAFSGALKIAAPYGEIAKHVDFGPDLHILIMTPEHKNDFEVALAVLDREWAMLGMLGSKRKRAQLDSMLRDKGVSEDLAKKIRIPVGADIGSETPDEIAVSIAADLVKLHAKPGKVKTG